MAAVPNMGVEVDITNALEEWSEFKLADGTKLRIRPVVVEVRRSKKFKEDGDPIYHIKSTLVVDAKVPSKLKKKKA